MDGRSLQERRGRDGERDQCREGRDDKGVSSPRTAVTAVQFVETGMI